MSSRLLLLPFDVREVIYDLLLVSDGNISLGERLSRLDDPLQSFYSTSQNLRVHKLRNLPLNPRFIKTCGQIYAEALPILYDRNRFLLVTDCPGSIGSFQALCQQDLRVSGHTLALIRRLRIQIIHLRSCSRVHSRVFGVTFWAPFQTCRQSHSHPHLASMVTQSFWECTCFPSLWPALSSLTLCSRSHAT